MTVAALYVETGGVYFGLPDVDPWDETRDARLYAGPWPVVAHPPCRSWSIMGQCRPEIVRGEDGGDEGCFEAALSAVQTYGGVLEHPARSRAWAHFGLPKPGVGGWYGKLFGAGEGWACEVDQRWYGHDARKPTWLYVAGIGAPPELHWARGPKSDKTIGRSYGQGRSHLRSRTPLACSVTCCSTWPAAPRQLAHPPRRPHELQPLRALPQRTRRRKSPTAHTPRT